MLFELHHQQTDMTKSTYLSLLYIFGQDTIGCILFSLCNMTDGKAIRQRVSYESKKRFKIGR